MLNYREDEDKEIKRWIGYHKKWRKALVEDKLKLEKKRVTTKDYMAYLAKSVKRMVQMEKRVKPIEVHYKEHAKEGRFNANGSKGRH